MASKISNKPVVGDIGTAICKLCGTHAGDSTTVSVTNDVGGHSSLPTGRYAVRITKSWDDYETGRRLIGELLDPKDIETSRKAGTTGHTPESYAKYGAGHVEKVKKAAAEFDPKTVYFHGDEFQKDSNTKIVNGALVTEIPVDTSVTNDQLEKQGHKYTVTKIKTFLGREGYGLNATLCRDKKAVAFIMDSGNGGMVDFDWVDQKRGESAEEAMFKGFIAEVVPPDPADKGSNLDPLTIQQFAMEQWVNAEVDRIQNDKRFRKTCKTKTLFQVGTEVGGDEFQVIKGVDLATRQYIEKKYAGQKIRILNDEFRN